MLELWKPLLVLKDKNNPVIFDELGFKYSEFINETDKTNFKKIISNNHPFIIFYDDKQDCYYYLKARGAYKFGTKQLRTKMKSEVLVNESAYDGLFSKDSYVDCSQIFKCNRELLESLVDIDNELYKNTHILGKYDITNILDTLKDNIFAIPPYLSIIEVKIDDKGNTYGESLYLCEEKINDIYDYYSFKGADLTIEFEDYLKCLSSNKNSEFRQEKNRFNNGINFCKLFLEEYFEDEIEEFNKIQGLDKGKEREL